MPQAILPIILAATAAIGTGTSLYQMANQPGQPKGQSPEEITKQAITSEQANRANATKQASAFLPELQSSTGGGLSPDAYSQLASQFSGNAQLGNSPQMQQLVSKFLGLDSGASYGGSAPFGSNTNTSPLQTGLAG